MSAFSFTFKIGLEKNSEIAIKERERKKTISKNRKNF